VLAGMKSGVRSKAQAPPSTAAVTALAMFQVLCKTMVSCGERCACAGRTGAGQLEERVKNDYAEAAHAKHGQVKQRQPPQRRQRIQRPLVLIDLLHVLHTHAVYTNWLRQH